MLSSVERAGILLSVQPRFARALLKGVKTAEVRRRFPVGTEELTVLLYSSSPDCAVIGSMRIAQVRTVKASSTWMIHGHKLDVEQPFLDAYLANAESAIVVDLIEASQFEHPVTLDSLRAMNLRPAQNYRYLSETDLGQLVELSRVGPSRSNTSG